MNNKTSRRAFIGSILGASVAIPTALIGGEKGGEEVHEESNDIEDVNMYKKFYGVKELPTYSQYEGLMKCQIYWICRQYIYEPNTKENREEIADRVERLMIPLQELGIIFDYKVICGESNNTKETIDKNELNLRYCVRETKSLDFKITDLKMFHHSEEWDDLNRGDI